EGAIAQVDLGAAQVYKAGFINRAAKIDAKLAAVHHELQALLVHLLAPDNRIAPRQYDFTVAPDLVPDHMGIISRLNDYAHNGVNRNDQRVEGSRAVGDCNSHKGIKRSTVPDTITKDGSGSGFVFQFAGEFQCQ